MTIIVIFVGFWLGWLIGVACTTRKLTGYQGLFGSRFWIITIPLAILVWFLDPVSGPGYSMAIMFLSFCWMCLHAYPGRRWDGSYYRRWYY